MHKRVTDMRICRLKQKSYGWIGIAKKKKTTQKKQDDAKSNIQIITLKTDTMEPYLNPKVCRVQIPHAHKKKNMNEK